MYICIYIYMYIHMSCAQIHTCEMPFFDAQSGVSDRPGGRIWSSWHLPWRRIHLWLIWGLGQAPAREGSVPKNEPMIMATLDILDGIL